MTYYYRAGKRVPVTLAGSAQVVRAPAERAPLTAPGWRTAPLSPGYLLLVQEPERSVDAVTRRQAEPDLDALMQRILERERGAGEHSEEEGPETPSPVRDRADVLAFPVAVNEDGNGLLFATGDVVAQFAPDKPRAEVEAHARARGWSIERTVAYLPHAYELRANVQADPFAFANELVEQQGALFAHPVFLEKIPDREALAERERTLPALFGDQWHLHNVGQNGARPGVDVGALRVWQITVGSPAVVICIIDSGVQSMHDVFQAPGKLVPGYDFAQNDAVPEPSGSSHGTACAAVAAAGSGAGRVLGIAPGCRVMPIRRSDVSSHTALGEAFVWAADHDADVINCSWGIDGQSWILPDIVRAAFQYATTHGRKGAGCPIFWAAGNGNELVSMDEWASSEYTIAVAASTDQATRAFYSDFGPEVDVCAPSSGGANGISTAINGGYTSTFGGTSSAAPLAAGVGALILSLAPHMRWFELRDLLRTTARKIDVDGGAYDDRGHSPHYGYGQVDAFLAVLAIDALLEVQRATGTEALASSMATAVDAIRQSAAGRVLLEYVSARRFSILDELQRSPAFGNALGGVLRLLAHIGEMLSTGQPITIPEASWATVALAAKTVMSLPPSATS